MKSLRAGAVLLSAVALGAALAVGPADAQSPYQGQTLRVASFGGNVDETYKKAMAGFEQEFGVTIAWVPGTTTSNAAKAVASKASPEFDVVMIDDVNQAAVAAMGDVLAPLDPAKISNYASLREQAVLPDRSGIPFGFNFTGLFYNTAEFEKNGWAAPTSWEDLFRPELCGHVGLMSPSVSYTTNILVLLAGGDMAKVPDAIDKMLELKDCVATLEPSSAKMEEKIQLGEYLVGVHGSVRVLPLIDAGYPVRFVIPTEGTMLSSTTVNATKGGNEALAAEFINRLISPEAQAVLLSDAYYIPANNAVEVPAALAEKGMPSTDELDKALNPDRLAINEQRRDWARRFERGFGR